MLCKSRMLAAALVTMLVAGSTASAQVTTAFSYQGQLKSSGNVVNSETDMQFSLWTLAVGGTQIGSTVTSLNVSVSNGLFSVPIDFGVSPYASSQNLYLQVAVRNPAGSGSYVPMGSRQLLTPAPFSLATRGIDVNAAGNVGIGTAPNARLHVKATSGLAFIVSGGMSFRDAPFTAGWDLGAGGSTAGVRNPFSLGRSGVSANDFYINGASGNVGINTNDPTAKLDVSGNARVSGGNPSVGQPTLTLAGPGGALLSSRSTNGGFTGWDVFMGSTNYAISRSGIDFPFLISATDGNASIGTSLSTFKLDVGGNIRCVTLTQTSTRDFKQDITPLSGALESIMKLRGVSYAWNDQAPEQVRGNHDIGFIADEMNAVLPDIVAKDASGKPVGIDYGKITPVAVEAIKQLKHENDQLKARLEKIEALLAAQANVK